MSRLKNRSFVLIGLVVCLALVLAPAVQAQNKDEEVPGNGKGGSSSGPVPNQAPPNDDCVNAIGPLAVPSVTTGYTSGGTTDSSFPYCDTGVTSPGVFYTVIGTGNTMTASLCGANNGFGDYDSKISVYCQGCSTPVCVAGNDDTCGLQSEVSWCSQSGAEYLILVHGFGGATGNFDVAVFDDSTACTGGVACLATGACCEPAGPCFIGTEAQCSAIGGTYLGDGTSCTNPGGTVSSYSSSPGSAIVDFTTTTDTVTVPDSFVVGDVNVELQIDHTWTADLEITLTHTPSGTSQLLVNDLCSGLAWDNLNATADDEGAETDCDTIVAGPSGTVFFSPLDANGGPLSVFDGLDSSGDWELSVYDDATGDTGTLNTWILHLEDGVDACAAQQEEEPIPTLQGAGVAALALLLVGCAILVIRRRM